jgi:hypothetical protein
MSGVKHVRFREEVPKAPLSNPKLRKANTEKPVAQTAHESSVSPAAAKIKKPVKSVLDTLRGAPVAKTEAAAVPKAKSKKHELAADKFTVECLAVITDAKLRGGLTGDAVGRLTTLVFKLADDIRSGDSKSLTKHITSSSGDDKGSRSESSRDSNPAGAEHLDQNQKKRLKRHSAADAQKAESKSQKQVGPLEAKLAEDIIQTGRKWFEAVEAVEGAHALKEDQSLLVDNEDGDDAGPGDENDVGVGSIGEEVSVEAATGPRAPSGVAMTLDAFNEERDGTFEGLFPLKVDLKAGKAAAPKPAATPSITITSATQKETGPANENSAGGKAPKKTTENAGPPALSVHRRLLVKHPKVSSSQSPKANANVAEKTTAETKSVVSQTADQTEQKQPTHLHASEGSRNRAESELLVSTLFEGAGGYGDPAFEKAAQPNSANNAANKSAENKA